MQFSIKFTQKMQSSRNDQKGNPIPMIATWINGLYRLADKLLLCMIWNGERSHSNNFLITAEGCTKSSWMNYSVDHLAMCRFKWLFLHFLSSYDNFVWNSEVAMLINNRALNCPCKHNPICNTVVWYQSN